MVKRFRFPSLRDLLDEAMTASHRLTYSQRVTLEAVDGPLRVRLVVMSLHGSLR